MSSYMSLIGLQTLRCLPRHSYCHFTPLVAISNFISPSAIAPVRHLSTNGPYGNTQFTGIVASITKCRTPITVASVERCRPLRTCVSRSWFHTSAPRNIPPVLLIIAKPLAKAASIITGRLFRKWWRALPAEHRANYRRHVFERRSLLALVGAGLMLAAAVHYYTHTSEAPVTHRRRYLAFTDKQFLELAEYEYKMQLEKASENIVLPTHPVYQRVVGVTRRIVDSNQDLEFMRQQTWTVLVVDSVEANAFVLPTGQIFVYTGLLRVAETDSQLAVVLGHEMAHAILSHAAEQVSFAAVLDVLIIVMMAAVWALMPSDGIAVITQWFYNKVIQLMLHLPYNRKLEEEADQVGLQLMAKACYDVRESSAFWNKMTLETQLSAADKDNAVELPEWLSTHPNNENRANRLDILIPAAIELRTSCNCPVLPTRDPRSTIKNLQKLAANKPATDDNSTLTTAPGTLTALTTAPGSTLARGATASTKTS